jgi:hypothetical protein
MAKYITNIQLQDADDKDYDTLQQELKKEYFKDEKHAAKSEAYIAGKAAFSREGNISLEYVSRAVLKAASKTGKKYSFFVMKNKHMVN